MANASANPQTSIGSKVFENENADPPGARECLIFSHLQLSRWLQATIAIKRLVGVPAVPEGR